MHSIVTTFRGADIKVEVANFCAAMDTLIDQDAQCYARGILSELLVVRLLACHARARVRFPSYWKESGVFKLMWCRLGGHGINYTSGTAVTWRGGTTATLT